LGVKISKGGGAKADFESEAKLNSLAEKKR
jgi:hypothetical protein